MTLNESLKCPVCKEATYRICFSSKSSTNKCLKCGGHIITYTNSVGKREISYIDKKEAGFHRKSIMVYEMVQQNINSPEFIEMMYEYFWPEEEE